MLVLCDVTGRVWARSGQAAGVAQAGDRLGLDKVWARSHLGPVQGLAPVYRPVLFSQAVPEISGGPHQGSSGGTQVSEWAAPHGWCFVMLGTFGSKSEPDP